HDEGVFSRLAAASDVWQGRAHAVELAERDAELVDDLGAVGAQPSATRRGVRPPRWDLGVGLGEHRDVQEHGGQAGLTHYASRDGAGEGGLPGVPTELGA